MLKYLERDGSKANVAHNSMVSANDLAEATERTGSVARMVGVDFDTMQGLIASAVRNSGLHGANLGNMFKTVFGSIHSDKAVEELEAIGVKMTEVGKDGTKSWRSMNSVMRDMMIMTASTTRDTEELTKAASGGKEFATYDKKLSYKKLHEPVIAGCVTLMSC